MLHVLHKLKTGQLAAHIQLACGLANVQIRAMLPCLLLLLLNGERQMAASIQPSVFCVFTRVAALPVA